MSDLEMLLKGSLRISAMSAAIKSALPLMCAERDACANAATYAKTHSSHSYTALKLQAEADNWAAAIAELERAMGPVEAEDRRLQAVAR